MRPKGRGIICASERPTTEPAKFCYHEFKDLQVNLHAHAYVPQSQKVSIEAFMHPQLLLRGQLHAILR